MICYDLEKINNLLHAHERRLKVYYGLDFVIDLAEYRLMLSFDKYVATLHTINQNAIVCQMLALIEDLRGAYNEKHN